MASSLGLLKRRLSEDEEGFTDKEKMKIRENEDLMEESSIAGEVTRPVFGFSKE